MKNKHFILKAFFALLFACVLTSFVGDDGYEICNPDKIYATNDYLYKDTYFKDYEKVDDFPKFVGGKDSIQAYFDRTVKLSEEESGIVARYHVTFMVNCKGEVGEPVLRSKQFPGYEKIVAAVGNMPNWLPTKKGKENVDCYVRLGFTNRGGKLDVDYREK